MSNLSLPSDTFNLFPADATSHVMQFVRMPMTSYVIQEVNLPGVAARTPTTTMPGLTINHMPDRLVYDPLTVTFLVDEEFQAWRELYAWMYGVTGGDDRSVVTAKFLQDHAEFVFPETPKHRFDLAARTTAGLTIVNAAKIPVLRFVFHNVYITGLSAVQFTTTSTDTLVPLTCQATFAYDWYSLVQIRR